MWGNLGSIRDHNMDNQKHLFLNTNSIKTLSASCPWVNHLSIALFLRQRKLYADFPWHGCPCPNSQHCLGAIVKPLPYIQKTNKTLISDAI